MRAKKTDTKHIAKKLLNAAKVVVRGAVRNALREQDDGWPEYHPALFDIEQYENATRGYFNECDYNEAQEWDGDFAGIQDVFREGWCWGQLHDEFGGRTEEYWQTIYAMARLHRYLESVLEWEKPR